MHWPFEPNREYRRRVDIHGEFGGQRQGGIVTPKGVPGIFIFTGAIGKTLGYSDRFLPDGSFRFTGKGQVGDMMMNSGNKALRDAAEDGKDILLFEILGKGKPVRFVNAFACAGWEYETQPDKNGNARQAIVFSLVPIESINTAGELEALRGHSAGTLGFAGLRAKALAATSGGKVPSKRSTATVFERSRYVREYVLSRANGICEGCHSGAPFLTTNGDPYLEAHHIRRLTDGGPDDIRFVAGVCPNCHRRAHYGEDRADFNRSLRVAIATIEAHFDEEVAV